jgi:hypothetical protein
MALGSQEDAPALGAEVVAEPIGNALGAMIKQQILPQSGIPNALGYTKATSDALGDVVFGKTRLSDKQREVYERDDIKDWFDGKKLFEAEKLADLETTAIEHSLDLIQAIERAREEMKDVADRDRLELVADFLIEKVSAFIVGGVQEKAVEKITGRLERYSQSLRARVEDALTKRGLSGVRAGRAIGEVGNFARGVGRASKVIGKASLITEGLSLPVGVAERLGGAYIRRNHEVVEDALDNAVIGRIPVLGSFIKTIADMGVSIYNGLYHMYGGESDAEVFTRLRSEIAYNNERLGKTFENLERIEREANDYVSRERMAYEDDILFAGEAEALMDANEGVFENMSKASIISTLKGAGYDTTVADKLGTWIYRYLNRDEVEAERVAYRDRRYVDESRYSTDIDTMGEYRRPTPMSREESEAYLRERDARRQAEEAERRRTRISREVQRIPTRGGGYTVFYD